jgi:FkbM family methyltransferase
VMTSAIFRDTLRRAVPFTAWQTAGFVKRLPSYWRIDRSQALRFRNRMHGLSLHVTDSVSVLSPEESVIVYLAWQYHGIEINESSREAHDFLILAKERHALMDIGAQTGFMSALFARSRHHPASILSVEPDLQCLPFLKRAVELNGGSNVDWEIATVAVSDSSGRISLPLGNWCYVSALRESERPCEYEVEARTLVDLVAGMSWQPDIIKIDTESFEYEIICPSLGLLERLRPSLQLEVHWEMLAARGRAAADFLAPLADMGYRGIRRRYRTYDAWLRAGRSEAVSRMALAPS